MIHHILCSLCGSLRKRDCMYSLYKSGVEEKSPVAEMDTTLETVLSTLLVTLLLLLHSIPVIIMINILIRPALWTAFNIVGLVYLWFTVILGGYKMVQLSTIVKKYISLEDTDETGCLSTATSCCRTVSWLPADTDLVSAMARVWAREADLELSCAGFVYWSGTSTAKVSITG